VLPLLLLSVGRLAHLFHRERLFPRRLIGVAALESQRSTVRFDPEHSEGEPDGHSASREEQESGRDSLDRRLRRDQVARTGNQGEAERPGDLADAVGGLRQPDTPRAQLDRKDSRRVRRDASEAPVEEQGCGEQEHHERRIAEPGAVEEERRGTERRRRFPSQRVGRQTLLTCLRTAQETALFGHPLSARKVTLVCVARPVRVNLGVDMQHDSNDFPPVGAFTFGLQQTQICDGMLLVIGCSGLIAGCSVRYMRVERRFGHRRLRLTMKRHGMCGVQISIFGMPRALDVVESALSRELRQPSYLLLGRK
jgi:hypothetical protein